MAKKMSRRMVALSSSAIAAVYLAGYLTTQAADSRLASAEGAAAPAIAAAAPPAASGAPTLAPGSIPTQAPSTQPAAAARRPATSAPAPMATSAPAASAAYKDDMYQGEGTSRRGDVAVAVTIQGGRIAGVEITDATTQYPVSRIARLPGQVVARQSAQVDRVSGATYSAQAFKQAVQEALAQAQHA